MGAGGPMEQVTSILTFAMLVSNFILMVIMWADKARTPEKNQNAKIANLEDQVEELRLQIQKEHTRLWDLEQSGIVTQEALLALLSHAIDGNNEEGLKKARNSLQSYLTHKGVTVER